MIAGCSTSPQTKTPTEVLKIFIEASKNKNVAVIKNSLSKGSLDLVAEAAKNQNISVEELLQKESGAPIKEMPETRSEKIEGDAATVEVKNKTTGEYEAIPFVKENGEWKIALDKFMQDVMQKANDGMKAPAANSSTGSGEEIAPPNSSNVVEQPAANKKK